MNIGNISALLGILIVVAGGAASMAVAQQAIAANTEAVDKLTSVTEQLAAILAAQAAEKRAKRETEARLCKSGAIDNTQWCITEGHDVPR